MFRQLQLVQLHLHDCPGTGVVQQTIGSRGWRRGHRLAGIGGLPVEAMLLLLLTQLLKKRCLLLLLLLWRTMFVSFGQLFEHLEWKPQVTVDGNGLADFALGEDGLATLPIQVITSIERGKLKHITDSLMLLLIFLFFSGVA